MRHNKIKGKAIFKYLDFTWLDIQKDLQMEVTYD